MKIKEVTDAFDEWTRALINAPRHAFHHPYESRYTLPLSQCDCDKCCSWKRVNELNEKYCQMRDEFERQYGPMYCGKQLPDECY